MPALQPLTIRFPVAGLNRRLSFQDQAPYTTVDCLNVFPVDVETGRERGGVRPGLTSIASRGSAPLGWTLGSYTDSGAKEALFVTYADGTYSTLNGTVWTQRISTAPGTDFANCAVYNLKLYQAQAGAKCKEKPLPSGMTADLSNANGGTAPENCGIVLSHADRLWLMGDSANPHVIYACAVGDATDWDYSKTTEGGAYTNTGSEGGQIGHAVTAAMSHDKRTLLIGSPHSTYAINGNPRASGQVERVHNRLGPISPNAWCKGEDAQGGNSTFVFTTDGLCVIPAGDYASLIPLSKNKIPDELRGVNPAAGDKVAIGFDGRWQVIHIAINPNSGSDINYAYHIPSDSYWPTEYSTTPQLMPCFAPVQTAARSSMLVISSGGAIYQYDAESTEDFSSYIWIGPLRLGSANQEGNIASIKATLATGSQDANWRLCFGDGVEEAYRQTSPAHIYTGRKWNRVGLNYSQQPRKGGYAAFLELFDVDGERWLIEEIEIERGYRGPRRVG